MRNLTFVAFDIVDHCNLNCARCCHFSSLVKGEHFVSLEECKTNFTRLYEIMPHDVDSRGISPTINLIGGEPLLHPQFAEILKLARECMPEIYILVITNGTKLNELSDEDINIINETGTEIRVSIYDDVPLDLSRVEEKINNFSKDYRGAYFNLSIDPSGNQNPVESYNMCDDAVRFIDDHSYGIAYLKHGKLYPCSVSAHIKNFTEYFNMNFKDVNDGMDIFSHTKEELLDYVASPPTLCKYCNIYKRRFGELIPHTKSEKLITEWV